MKEYEKLAQKSASYRCSTANTNLDNALKDVHSFGFVQGFLKAREMALTELSEKIWVIGHIRDVLLELGENEV